MKLIFYLDESGNSGDALFREGNNSPILDQPSFALAGVGFPQHDDLDRIVHNLKKKYNVQAADLKASNVFKKPRFIQELLEKIIEQKYPLFIELMDKRYFVAANIVSFYFIRDLARQDPMFASMGRYLAAIISDDFNETVLIKYSQMCRSPSKENFVQFAKAMHLECMTAINKDIQGKEFLSILLMILESDLEEIHSGELDESVVERFIPPHDRNKRGEIVAMLPHVNAFANLYARINRFVKKHIQLDIIHDEQAHFDEILRFWEEALRTNQFTDMVGGYWNQSVDFIFTERAHLKFAKSEMSSGIQIADVIAGFCTRYFNQVQGNQRESVDKYSATIKLIRELSDSGNSQGLNIVASRASIVKFYSMHLE